MRVTPRRFRLVPFRQAHGTYRKVRSSLNFRPSRPQNRDGRFLFGSRRDRPVEESLAEPRRKHLDQRSDTVEAVASGAPIRG